MPTQNECGAAWLPTSSDVLCQMEPDHPGEHSSLVLIEYGDGIEGLVKLTWMQESQRTEEPQ